MSASQPSSYTPPHTYHLSNSTFYSALYLNFSSDVLVYFHKSTHYHTLYSYSLQLPNTTNSYMFFFSHLPIHSSFHYPSSISSTSHLRFLLLYSHLFFISISISYVIYTGSQIMLPLCLSHTLRLNVPSKTIS